MYTLEKIEVLKLCLIKYKEIILSRSYFSARYMSYRKDNDE